MSNKHLELLHLAQQKNSDANPSYLLQQGANPNIRDPFYHNWTPLHYAVFLNKENFALQLVKHSKTNVQLLDSDGFSPLYWASKKSTAKVIKALLSKGCNPNERDMHGMTALFAAVASNKKENVAALLDSKQIDVNQPNQFGGSALHHTAFATDNVEIADMLVQKGGNLFLYDYENQTPLHVAKRRKRQQLFKYFKLKMKEDEPAWQCDVTWGVSSPPDDTTSTTSTTDIDDYRNDIDETKSDVDDEISPQIVTQSVSKSQPSPQRLVLPKSMTDTVSNPSPNISYTSHHHHANQISNNDRDFLLLPSKANNHSNCSTQSSHSTHSHYSDRKTMSNHSSNRSQRSQPRPILSSPSVSATAIPSPWHAEHDRKLKKVQENKLNMVLKIEQSHLNKEARELLQEQQYYFQYEQEVFYESMKHEYDKLHYQLGHFMQLNKELIRSNTNLQHEVAQIRQQQQKTHNLNNYRYLTRNHNQMKKKSKQSKYQKDFKKWYKKTVGIDFMCYYPLFVKSGFDDLRTIKHINHEQELTDLGIDKKGHRLHILEKIENYRLKYHQTHNEDIALPAMNAANVSHHSLSNDSNNSTGYLKMKLLDDPSISSSFPVEGTNKTE